MPEIKYLIIAGPIGVGKSTLTRHLAAEGFHPLFEEPDVNPYLEDFYADRSCAFETQLAFLAHRLQQRRQVAGLLKAGGKVVQDRSMAEDHYIFTRHHYQHGLISERDYQTYQTLYNGVIGFVPPAELIIYLSAPVPILQARIRERGRDYEQDIKADYLTELNLLYTEWAQLCRQTRQPFIELPTAESQGPEDILQQALRLLEPPTLRSA